MRRMARVVTAGTLVFATASMLTGCASGGGPAASSSATTDADAAPTTITVFAAASLTEAFDTLAAQFEAEHPNADVVLSYGGSAALAQQVLEGAPVDVFASAAESPMQTVGDAGLAVDPVVFATNTLELAVPSGNPVGVVGLDDLANPDLRIALCDPSVR